MRPRVIMGSLSTSTLIQVVTVVTGLLLARALGPEDRGELAAALLWPAVLASVGSLGLADSSTFFAARAKHSVGALIGTSLVFALTVAVPLVAVGAVLFPLLLADYGDDTLHAALLFLGYIPLNLAALALMGIVAGQQRYLAFNALRFMVVGASAAGVVGLALAGELRVTSAAAVYLIANLVTVAAAAVCALTPWPGRLRFDAAASRDLFRFGVRAHVSGVSSLMNERLDYLVISLALAPASLGLYVVAGTLTSPVALVGTSIALMALPVAAGELDAARRAAVARRAISSTLFGSVLIMVPLVLLTPQLIALFFGSAFEAAVVPARVLLVGAIVLGVGRSTAAILKALDRPLQAGSAELVALCTTAIGLAVLLPRFGMTGAALASLIAYAVSAAWMLRQASRALGVPLVAMLALSRTPATPVVGAER